MNQSIWKNNSIHSFSSFSKGIREKKSQYDVVVVGGGITGLSVAYFLKEAGLKVCVLEKGEIGSGNTGLTTAHLTSNMDTRISDLVQGFGEKKARLVYEAGETAIQAIETIVRRHRIECDFKKIPGYFHLPWDIFDDEENEANRLREEAGMFRHLGVEAEYENSIPFFLKPGICFKNQAKFHPLHYLLGLAFAIEGNGSKIYEHSEVLQIEKDPLAVVCRGGRITCEQVVLATHVPTVLSTHLLSGMLFQTKLPPYTSYVVSGKIEKGILPEALFWDTSDPYFYLRVDAHQKWDQVILGGLDHKTGQELQTESRFFSLQDRAQKMFPKIRLDHQWSGQVIESPDGLPFIGEIAPNRFVASGYSGNGFTLGTLAGILIRDEILESVNPWQELFSPHRKQVRAGGWWEYVKENIDYPVHLVTGLFSGKNESVSSLKKGEGKILRIEGKSVACSRDEKGKLHSVSAVCTHLGCTVNWNGAEKTWDCPCHGSRFNRDGKVCAGPANQPLETIPLNKKAPDKKSPTRGHTQILTSQKSVKNVDLHSLSQD